MTHYYNIKLVTFGVDDHHSLVITLPVFEKAFNRKSPILHETDIIPVLINDLIEDADSYSTVTISKFYMTINDEYCIQLHSQELHMCKLINHEYFYEDLFLENTILKVPYVLPY